MLPTRTFFASRRRFAGAPLRFAFGALVLLAAGLGAVAPAVAQNIGVLPTPNLDLKMPGSVYAIARTPDGKLVIGGEFTEVDGAPRAYLARFNADGSLDTAWNPAADNAITALAVDASGNVYAGGYFQNIGGLARPWLAKLDAVTGAADPEWNAFLQGSVAGLAFDATGLLYVTGVSEAGLVYLLRIDAAGDVDPSWTPNTGDLSPTDIAVSDGWAYLSGSFFGPDNVGALRRFSTLDSGSYDFGWQPSPNARVSDIDLHGANLYVAGSFTQMGNAARNYISRVSLQDGLPDPGWTPDADAAVSEIDADATGVFAAGEFTRIGGSARGHVAKLSLVDGGAVAGWNPGTSEDGFQSALIAAGDGGAWLGGDTSFTGGLLRPGLAKILPTGAVDASVAPRVLLPGYIFMTAALSDGSYLVGGDFVQAGATVQTHLLRLKPDLTLDENWAVELDGPTSFAIEVGTGPASVILGGSFQRVDGIAHARIVRLAPDSTPVHAWNPQVASTGGGTVNSLHVDGGKLFIGGQFDRVNGQARNDLAKLDLATGALDPTWSANTDGNVLSIVGDGAGSLFVGGEFQAVDGVARSRLVKISTAASGVVDPVWNANAGGGFVRRLLFDAVADRLYVAGFFTSLGGDVAIRKLGRVAASGSGAVDAGWLPRPGSTVRTLVLDANGRLYFGGSFSSLGNRVVGRLARTNVRTSADGTPDLSWLPNPDVSGISGSSPIVYSIAALVGGGVLVGGDFLRVDGVERKGVAAVGDRLERGFADGFE